MRSSLLLSTLIVALNTLLVKALVADFGQCGGINWKGESQCLPGSFCYWNNDFYSQCFPPPYLTATPTGCVPRPTAGYNPIKASTPGIPVFGLAVKDLPDRNAQLTTEGILGTYEYQITQGLTYLRMKMWTTCGGHTRWLSLRGSTSDPVVPVVFTSAAESTPWAVSPDLQISTSASSPWGAHSTFLACGDKAQLYLQRGNATVPGVQCVETSLTISV
ncbi:hypothetical protein FRC03_009104 [Tulasnella sp. 419]|nr:hypothetical protein FRC03_009104 [Tulasnella sp. 419]